MGAHRARTGVVSPSEEKLFRRINDLPDVVSVPVWLVMQAGSLGAVGVAAGLAWRLGRPRQSAALALSGFAVWASCKELKHRVGRGRPDAHLPDVTVRGRPQSGLGYPSGHSGVAATLAVVLAAGATPVVKVALTAAAAGVGFGRAYTGAHLPLDIAGGFGYGVSAGALTRLVVDIAM